MMPPMEWLWIILGIVVVVAIVVGIVCWAKYNGLVALNGRVDEAWSDIVAQLAHRGALVPELIETVRGYAAHEKDVFERLSQARQASVGASTPREAAAAESQMQVALRSILSVAEAYPQLQASQGFLQLQGQLVDTEDRIQAARRHYNGGVRELNTRIRSFPNSLFAKRLRLGERDFFEVPSSAAMAEPPRVQF